MEPLVRETTTAAQSIRSEQAPTTATTNLVSFAFAMTTVFIAAIAMSFVGIATSSIVILGAATIISTAAAFVGVYGTKNLMNR